MISAQRFVEEWRQSHARESMTIEGLAEMMVAYAEQFIAQIHADEREQHPDIPTVTRAAMEAALPMIYDMLRAKVESLGHDLDCAAFDDGEPGTITNTGDHCDCFQSDVLALLDGGSDG
jgi:hypothetical protein